MYVEIEPASEEGRVHPGILDGMPGIFCFKAAWET